MLGLPLLLDFPPTSPATQQPGPASNGCQAASSHPSHEGKEVFAPKSFRQAERGAMHRAQAWLSPWEEMALGLAQVRAFSPNSQT